MNREFLLDAVLGVAFGVFLALALAWTARPLASSARRRGLVAAALVYALIAANVVLREGVNLWLWLALCVLVIVPLMLARVSAARQATAGSADTEPALVRAVQDLVGIGLLVIVLTATAQLLSLMGRLDPRMCVIVVALVAAVIATVAGLRGCRRVGFWAAWLLLLPLVVVVMVAALVGNPADLASPTVVVGGPSPGQWAALALVLAALGWADPALRAIGGSFDGAQLSRSILGLLVILLVGGISTLVFLGGSTVGPSLAFFTLPANLDIVPGPIIVIFLAFTVLVVAMAASLLAGTGGAGAAPTERPNPTRVAIVALIAVVLTLLGLGLLEAAVLAGLLAACLLGAGLSRGAQTTPPTGVLAGLVVAAISAIILLATDKLEFDWPAALAIIAVTGVSLAVASARTDADHEPATM